MVGLPRDEVLPALFLFLLFFAMRYQIMAFIVSTAWFMGLRTIKKQFGDNIVQLVGYWWGADWFSSSIFKRTPPAEKRFWIR